MSYREGSPVEWTMRGGHMCLVWEEEFATTSFDVWLVETSKYYEHMFIESKDERIVIQCRYALKCFVISFSTGVLETFRDEHSV